jgi:hypothetical protein
MERAIVLGAGAVRSAIAMARHVGARGVRFTAQVDAVG